MSTTREASRLSTKVGSAIARSAVPLGFPIIYIGWAYLFWAPIVTGDQSVWSVPNVFFLVIGASSPLLAGLVMMWYTKGRTGVRDLGHRMIDVGRISPRWWVLILLFWPTFNLIMAGAALALGVTSEPLELISSDRLFDPIAVGSILVFAFVAIIPEEVGLRGYWLDELQERYSALVSGVINGSAWAIWHAPFVLFPGYYANTTFDPELSWWMPMLVFYTLTLVWIYNNTNRSLLAVLCFHALTNMTGEILGFRPEMYPFVVTGYVVVAVLLVAVWSPGSLRGWGTSRPNPPAQS